MHRILVDEKKWVEESRYLHALNFCMLLPGPEAQKLATYVGWLLHGTRGGLAAGILFVLADKVLTLLYHGDKFLAAVPVLRILVWSIVLGAITQALGQVLLAGGREIVTLRIVAVNAVVSLTLGVLLINLLGPLRGAPLATLIAGGVNVVQHYVPVSRLLGGISMGRLAWSPAGSETAP